jgi:hypothetical protein
VLCCHSRADAIILADPLTRVQLAIATIHFGHGSVTQAALDGDWSAEPGSFR